MKNVDKVVFNRRFSIDDPDCEADVCCIEIIVNKNIVAQYLWDENPLERESAWLDGYKVGRRLDDTWVPTYREVSDWSD